MKIYDDIWWFWEIKAWFLFFFSFFNYFKIYFCFYVNLIKGDYKGFLDVSHEDFFNSGTSYSNTLFRPLKLLCKHRRNHDFDTGTRNVEVDEGGHVQTQTLPKLSLDCVSIEDVGDDMIELYSALHSIQETMKSTREKY